MTVTFIPASDLKQKYKVLGHIYSLNVPGIDLLKCRSVLEITLMGVSHITAADAIFVMMNPGSSKPVAEINHVVDSARISRMTTQLVPTVPDTTQYQVMRIMHYLGWNHVRVLNLSDLRDPKSGSFAVRYEQLEAQTGSEVHSVFAPERTSELQTHLSRKSGAPIVYAWGVSDDLTPLITRAIRVLAPESPVTGLPKPGQSGKYFHPLPSLQSQKEQWVVQMLEQLHA